MIKIHLILLSLAPFLIYSIYFNVKLFSSNLFILKSVESLKDFEFEQATKESQEAIRLSPINAEAYINHAYIIGVLWIFRKEEKYKKQMDQSFNKAFDLNPKNALYHYKKASIYSDVGDFTEAINQIEEAIKIDPYAGAYWNEKGVYLEMSGRNQEAIKAYQKAFDLSKRRDIQISLDRLKGIMP